MVRMLRRPLKPITCALALIAAFSSCKKDFLQRDTGVPVSRQDVFSDPVLAARFADNTYNFQIDDYGRLGTGQGYKGTTGQFTDEAVFSGQDPYVAVINQGRFLDPIATDVTRVYARMYEGIRNANTMLSEIDNVPWTEVQNAELIRAQMFFLRGMSYFELVKRFGGVALLDKALDQTDNLDLPRSTYEETVAFILNDLAEAERILLAETFGDVYSLAKDWNAGNFGRPTVGAVRALRSRLLLLDASPLHNPGNDPDKWKKAAEAAKAVIDMNKYKLHPNYRTLLTVSLSDEYILIKVRGPRGFGGMINDFIVPPSSGGAQALLNPTQNHVDLYEMINGKPITDPTSGYKPNEPYRDRDPRFYANIIYNDQDWQGRKIEMFTGGRDYQPASNNYTRTRYYCRKLWPEVFKGGGNPQSVLNFIFFRYGEVLLNYAEALNEFDGPTAEVYRAVNQIRTRALLNGNSWAAMATLPAGLDQAGMRKRIHNERAVEFAFEEMRWWDILRWKKGPEIVTKTVNAMDVVKIGTAFKYTVTPLPTIYQRTFEDHMHLYPIPRNEVDKSNGVMTQNPGW